MQKLNRREFPGTAVAGTVALNQTPAGAAAAAAGGRKIKLGLIGCGGYGLVDLKAAFKAGGVEVIALCDVDCEHLANGVGEVEKLQGQRPQTFRDCRDLLKARGSPARPLACRGVRSRFT